MLYCEFCQIYYTLKNDIQQISSLPIRELDQTSLDLCKACTRRLVNGQREVICRTAEEYLSGIGLCRGCKASNRSLIHNLYYKNFLFHRKFVRPIGWISSLFILLFLYLLPPNPIVRWFFAIMIEYKQCRLGHVRFILLTLICVKLGNFDFVSDSLLVYMLYRLLFFKTVVFSLPANLSCHKNLNSFIERLNINGSMLLDQDIAMRDVLRSSDFCALGNTGCKNRG